MSSRGKSTSQLLALFTLPTLCLLLQHIPSPVASYPIFGTKRYHRNNAPQFIAPQPLQMQYDPMDGYYADDPSNYLYYAPHDPQYHSYGMPVYRGDYKPTPYLYAQGPTYQYYEDNKGATNPLDDLHEEMLEEDERERAEKQHQKQQQMRQYYQQHNHHQPPQMLSNANEDDYPELIMKQPTYYQPNYEAQQQQQQQQPLNVDYAEDENGDFVDASYAQANAAFLNDLIQYNRQISKGRTGKQSSSSKTQSTNAHAESRNRNVQSGRRDYSTNWNLDYPTGAGAAVNYDEQWQQPADYDYEGYSMDSASGADGHKTEDKAVRQLEALTHSRDKTSPNAATSSSPLRKVDPMHPHQVENQFNDEDYWSGAGSAAASSSLDKDSELNGQNNNYEYDDEWINWDSKRSVGQPISITAFTDRKPAKVMKVPENHFVLDTTSTASPQRVDKITSLMAGKSGQKEEVLMRPAPPVRNPFSAPVMKMLEHQESLKTNKYEQHVAVEDLDNKKRSESNSSSERKPKATLYDTIKHLLDMEQQLKEVSLF